ncbi:MAG: ABC transporter permease [Chitinophagaceae bacterium]
MSVSSSNGYSQMRALGAIIKASFRAILSNPSAIVFSLGFPIIFVLIFSAFGNNNGATYKITIHPLSDTLNIFYQSLQQDPSVKIVRYPDSTVMQKELLEGKLTGTVLIKKTKDSSLVTYLSVQFFSTTASAMTTGPFLRILDYVRLKTLQETVDLGASAIKMEPPLITEVRPYRPIDFVLPGQLGFSILFSTLFGIAFTFYGLREQLVLKRFFATPVRRIHILVGIGLSRISFQLLTVLVLLLFGYWVLDFTLQNGVYTVLSILSVTILMLFLLMGVALVISSVAKTDSNIPLLINLFGLPQLLLSGTFFSVDVFPAWMQSFCEVLPLKQFNDAIRIISFEGHSFFDTGKEVLILSIWIVVVYWLAAKVLRWE